MKFLDEYAEYTPWFLRLALASVFLFHGLQKLLMAGPYDMMVGKMGMAPVVFYLVTLAEVGGGALVLLGGFVNDLVTRLGGLMIVPVMLGAIAMVHWGQWSFGPSETHPAGGMEFQVTLLLIALYFVVAGNAKPQTGTQTQTSGTASPSTEEF